MGLKQRAGRNLSAVVVVGIEHLVVPLKQLFERFPIAIEGDVKHGEFTAGNSIELVEQGDVAFYPGDQAGIGLRGLETQLLQGADPVGIAVEDIDTGHGDRR